MSEEQENNALTAVLVQFVAGTEMLHDSIEVWDRPKIIAAVESLYAARNALVEAMAEFPEQDVDDRPEPPIGDGWRTRSYRGTCPMGHTFGGVLTGPETPEDFVMECPTMFCGAMEMQANAL